MSNGEESLGNRGGLEALRVGEHKILGEERDGNPLPGSTNYSYISRPTGGPVSHPPFRPFEAMGTNSLLD